MSESTLITIDISVNGDAGGADAVAAGLRDVGSAADAAGSSAEGASAGLDSIATSVGSVGGAADAASSSIASVGDAADSVGASASSVSSSVDAAGASFAQLGDAAGGAGGGLDGFNAAAGDAGDGAGQLGGSVQDVSISMSQGEGSFRAIRSALTELGAAARSPVGPLGELNSATGGVAAAALGMAPVVLHLGEAFGPPGVAAGVAVGLLSLFGKGAADQVPKINQLAQSLVTLHDGAQAMPAPLQAGTEQIAALVEKAGGGAGNVGTFSAALAETKAQATSSGAPYQKLVSDLGDYNATVSQSAQGGMSFNEILTMLQKSGQEANQVQADAADVAQQAAGAQRSYTSAVTQAPSALSDFGGALEGVNFAAERMGGSMGNASDGSLTLDGSAGAVSGTLQGFAGAAVDAADANAELASAEQMAASQNQTFGSSLMSVVDDMNAAAGTAVSYAQALQQSQQTEYGGMTPATNQNWGTSPMAVGTGGIQALATGGYITSPMIALIGEDEPEYVIPQHMVGSGGYSPLPAGVGGGSVVVNININVTVQGSGNAGVDGRAIATAIQKPLMLDIKGGMYAGIIPRMS